MLKMDIDQKARSYRTSCYIDERMNMSQESELRLRFADVNGTREWSLSLETHACSSLWIKNLPSEGVDFLPLTDSYLMETAQGPLESEGFPQEIIGGESWDRHSGNKTSSHADSSLILGTHMWSVSDPPGPCPKHSLPFAVSSSA